MAEVQIKSTAATGTPHKHEIKAGQYTLTADAPKEFGGSTGMEPHELMLSALGACTSITIQMYAERKGWPVKNISIKLNEETVEDTENPGKKISKITREIDLEGDLTQEQIDGLKAIADKCPIHKLLVGPKQIVTNVHNKEVAV